MLVHDAAARRHAHLISPGLVAGRNPATVAARDGARHTALMRLAAAIGFLTVVVAGAGAWLLLSSRDDTGSVTSPRVAPAAAKPDAPSAQLPPLPDTRPRVVEPEAGATAGARESRLAPRRERAAPDRTTELPQQRRRDASRAPGRDPDLAGAATAGARGATALGNGVALPPLEAPEAVRQIIEAGNAIARTPYKWGGGHGRWQDTGYDCSGSVSFALAAAGLLDGPLDSGSLMSWGRPGRGRWVTVWANDGHVYLEVAGIRFDTSGARQTGSRWQNELRDGGGFVARHPDGL